MAKIETWFDQDLKSPVKVRYIDGNVFSQDNRGNLVGVNVFSDGVPVQLSGSVSASIIRADGATVAAEGTLTYNQVFVVLPAAAYAVPGTISIVIKLTGDGSTTTLCAVVSNVYMSETDTVVDPGTIIPSVAALIAEIEAVIASIPADYSELIAAVGDLTREVAVDNLLDLCAFYHPESPHTHNGITYTKNGDAITAVGTSTTSNSYYELYSGRLPDGFVIGRPYFVKYESKGTLELAIYCYDANFSTRVQAWWITSCQQIVIPEGTENLIVRLLVETSGATVNETVYPHIYSNTTSITDLKENMYLYNSYNIIGLYTPENIARSDQGLTYTWGTDGGCTVTGTKTGTGVSKYEMYRGLLPTGFVPGSTVYVKMDSASAKVMLRLYFYDSDYSSETRVTFFIPSDRTITIPDMAVNVIIWLGVEGYAGTVFNETVHPKMITAGENRGDNITNYNTFNYTVNHDSYTVTATPEITSTTDLYLPASGTTADRTADIMTLLSTQGVCKLGPGDFYISTGIAMPDNTSLIGCGKATRLILDSSVTNGYVISVGSLCNVQDMTITGSLTNLPYEDREVGTRDGIVQLGDYTDFNTHTFSANYDKLSNLWIENFTGSGIRSYRNDGGGAFLADNIDILRCGIGVNIELFSEFHAWSNIRTRWCVYGCVMNGGNNLFSNCHFDVCIHLLKIDNSLSQLINDTHSSFVNCTFCHANNNTGNAMEITGVGNGLVFSNCQVFYAKIVLTDCAGVVMNGFNFGNGEEIILTRCTGIELSNSIFGSAPVITRDNVTGFIFSNNMTRSGAKLGDDASYVTKSEFYASELPMSNQDSTKVSAAISALSSGKSNQISVVTYSDNPITYQSTSNPYQESYISIAKSGYTPIGVVGWNAHGTSSSYVYFPRMTFNNTYLFYTVRSAATVTSVTQNSFTVLILYRKDT